MYRKGAIRSTRSLNAAIEDETKVNLTIPTGAAYQQETLPCSPLNFKPVRIIRRYHSFPNNTGTRGNRKYSSSSFNSSCNHESIATATEKASATKIIPTATKSTALATSRDIESSKPVEDIKKLSQEQQQKENWFNIWYKIILSLWISILFVTFFYTNEIDDVYINDITNSTATQNENRITFIVDPKHQHLADKNEQLKGKIEKNRAFERKMEKEVNDLQQEVMKSKRFEIEVLKQTEEDKEEKLKMQQRIQAFSKKLLIEKYGIGPHYVEMQVDFDPAAKEDQLSKQNTNTGDRVILELAPIDLMPHSVYFFLEQVHNKLYDGFSFHINADHVIQAGPKPNFSHLEHLALPSSSSSTISNDDTLPPPSSSQQHQNTVGDNKGLIHSKVVTKESNLYEISDKIFSNFINSGLKSVLFAEYSPKFPHQEMTLGFAGGSFNFYISMEDNSKAHGPVTDDKREQYSDGEPCFAKVVSGFDTLKRIQQLENHHGSVILKNNVAIRSMRIVQIDSSIFR